MPLPPGAVIAGFTVLRLLGEGGMGAVYLVQHPDLPRHDVLKVMHGAMAQQPALRARFEHEARLAAGLNHPHIVQVFDRGIADDHLWIRMQFVAGTDAARALEDGPMHPRRVLRIVRSVGSALDYAHRSGLLHRDVKPANILLAPGERPDDPEHAMLTDFGIAKAMDTDVRLTGTGQALLTPAYSAPERFGSAPIDSRIDVYSLGCTLFELLTGRLPYPYDGFLALIRAHDQEPVPDIRELRPELPPGVSDVVRTALAKNRDERFPTCRALVDAFAVALERGRPPVPPPPDPRRTAPDTVQRPPTAPSGPYRVTVRWGTDGAAAPAGAAQLDTTRLGIDDRRRVETLVQEACAARAWMTNPEPAAPGASLVELTIEHPAGGERIRYVDGGGHHPPVWERLADAVAGPGGMAEIRRPPVPPADRNGDARTTGERRRGVRLPLLAALAVVVIAAGVVVGVVLWTGRDTPSGQAADGTTSTSTSTDPDDEVAAGDVPTVYGVDGNTGNALADSFTQPGSLDGMAGITPLAPLASDFTDRLSDHAPNLESYQYSGEAYDAAVVVALAAAMAGTNDSQIIKQYVTGVTTGGETCTSFEACLEVIDRGGNPDYDGVTGPLDLDDHGDPARGNFAILQFGRDNLVDSDATEYVLVGDAEDAADDEGQAATQAGGGQPLVLGTLLPVSGNIAFLGPAMVAGVELAVEEINSAGGVFGRPVELREGDSGDSSTDMASRTLRTLLDGGVDAIIGTGSSVVTLSVLDQVRAAGVVMISPANTSDLLTTRPDDGLYFRVAPTDRLQGRALAELITADGHHDVGLLIIDDPYGDSLGAALEDHLAAAGVTTTSVVYDYAADSFADYVTEIAATEPDAVVVVGYGEAADIIRELNAQGIGPAR